MVCLGRGRRPLLTHGVQEITNLDFVFHRNVELHFVVSFGVAAWHYICMVLSGRRSPCAWPVGRWQMGDIVGPQLAASQFGQAGALIHLSH